MESSPFHMIVTGAGPLSAAGASRRPTRHSSAPTWENLVFDTAGCADFDFARRFTARYSAQRVVFGSGRYSSTTARKRHHILSDLLAADLPDEDKHAIVAGNISRIFGL